MPDKFKGTVFRKNQMGAKLVSEEQVQITKFSFFRFLKRSLCNRKYAKNREKVSKLSIYLG